MSSYDMLTGKELEIVATQLLGPVRRNIGVLDQGGGMLAILQENAVSYGVHTYAGLRRAADGRDI